MHGSAHSGKCTSKSALQYPSPLPTHTKPCSALLPPPRAAAGARARAGTHLEPGGLAEHLCEQDARHRRHRPARVGLLSLGVPLHRGGRAGARGDISTIHACGGGEACAGTGIPTFLLSPHQAACTQRTFRREASVPRPSGSAAAQSWTTHRSEKRQLQIPTAPSQASAHHPPGTTQRPKVSPSFSWAPIQHNMCSPKPKSAKEEGGQAGSRQEVSQGAGWLHASAGPPMTIRPDVVTVRRLQGRSPPASLPSRCLGAALPAHRQGAHTQEGERGEAGHPSPPSSSTPDLAKLDPLHPPGSHSVRSAACTTTLRRAALRAATGRRADRRALVDTAQQAIVMCR